MRLLQRDILTELGQTWTLYPISDVHLGNVNTDVQAFDNVLAEIRRDPFALWIGNGDFIEAIAPNDKRWSFGGIDEKIVNLASADRIADVYVSKLAAKLGHPDVSRKLISYSSGNHEQRFCSTTYSDVSQRVLHEIGRSDAWCDWAGLTKLNFKDKNNHHVPVRIFHAHGWQAGRTDGAKVNQSRSLMAWIDADIYLQGHSHSKFVIPQTRLAADQAWTKLTARTVYVCHTGSFLRTMAEGHAGYAERAGYPPTTLGCIKFRLTPHKDRVDIEAVT